MSPLPPQDPAIAQAEATICPRCAAPLDGLGECDCADSGPAGGLVDVQAAAVEGREEEWSARLKTPEEVAALANGLTIETPNGAALLRARNADGLEAFWSAAGSLNVSEEEALAYLAAELAEKRSVMPPLLSAAREALLLLEVYAPRTANADSAMDGLRAAIAKAGG